MLDQADGVVDQRARIDPLRRRGVAAREPEQTADHLVDPAGLREDRLRARREALVVRHLRQELLGARRDHAERRGDLVRDTHRQRAHDRGPGGALQALVVAVLRLCDREAALEHQLLPLHPQGDAAEREHEAGGREDAQDQTAPRPQLAIALALRGGDRQDVPGAAASGVDARQAGERGPRREPKRGRLLARNADDRLTLPEGVVEAGRRDLATVGGAQLGRARRAHEDRQRFRALDRAELAQQVAGAEGGVLERADVKARPQRGRERRLLLGEVLQRGGRLALGVPVRQPRDQYDGHDHRGRDRRAAAHRARHVELELPGAEGGMFNA